MNIVVLAGGLSTERKISFSSGTKICAALRSRGHKAVLVDLFNGLEDMGEDVLAHPSKLFENLPELVPVVFDGKAPDLVAVRKARKYRSPSLFGLGVLDICREADVVFIALHGMNGEDGRVQATFDLMGIPYTGSDYLGAAMAMDKIITKKMVMNEGVKTPAWNFYTIRSESDIKIAVEENPVPCVVKTTTGGSSVGVYIIKEQSKLEKAIRDCKEYGPDVLIEQYIAGREFTCGVLGERALPSVEIVPKTNFYDYENKYQAGATDEICPGRCTPAVEEQIGEMSLTVHHVLGLLTYSRSDFIVTDDDEVYFLEVNTLPGMTPTSLVPQEAAAVGITYEEVCQYIVDDAMKRIQVK